MPPPPGLLFVINAPPGWPGGADFASPWSQGIHKYLLFYYKIVSLAPLGSKMCPPLAPKSAPSWKKSCRRPWLFYPCSEKIRQDDTHIRNPLNYICIWALNFLQAFCSNRNTILIIHGIKKYPIQYI